MAGLEVCDGEGHLEDAVIGAGAHVEVVHGDAQLVEAGGVGHDNKNRFGQDTSTHCLPHGSSPRSSLPCGLFPKVRVWLLLHS